MDCLGLSACSRFVVTRSLDTPLRRIIQDRGVTTHFQPIFSARQKSGGRDGGARARHLAGREARRARRPVQAGVAEGLAGRIVEKLCRESAVQELSRLARAQARRCSSSSTSIWRRRRTTKASPPSSTRWCGWRGFGRETWRWSSSRRAWTTSSASARWRVALRQRGFLVVLDDVGAGHSNLDRIPLIRPDIIKIDRSLITGVDADFYKQETFKSLVSLSRRIGALVVAEGIETEREAVAALELGADLLQGYFLGRPQAGGQLRRRRVDRRRQLRRHAGADLQAAHGRRDQRPQAGAPPAST